MSLQPQALWGGAPEKWPRALDQLRSESAARRQPDALEAQLGLGAEDVKVGVVVQDAEVLSVGDRGEDEVDRRQAVVPGAGQLGLRADRAPFDLLVDPDLREREQLLGKFGLLVGATRGVTGFQ